MKKFIGIILIMSALFCFALCTNANEQVCVYVSTSGNDSNDGSKSSPVQTFDVAYKLNPDKIILMSDITEDISSYKNLPEIEGYTGSEVLTLPSSLSLSSALNIDNLKLSGVSEIIANGKALTIGQNATTASNITVYGGKSGASLTGNTQITLLGGTYDKVYGGGKNGSIVGNTNVVIGGNVNQGKDIDDADKDTSDLAPTNVYGGCYNASVSGTANITLKENAIVYYIYGAGVGSSQVKNTNISIEGGKVASVYGGAPSNGTTLTDTNTKITMTDGEVESIFGGSEGLAMTGNTSIELISGTVYRRVYSGCYNAASRSGISLSWSSSHVVSGTTTLMIYPEMSLNQNSNLSADNNSNIGVYAGSRVKSASDIEVNTVIFERNCYSSKNGVMGSQDVASKFVGLQSYPDYTVKSGANGVTYGTYDSSKLFVKADSGYIAEISGIKYNNEEIPYADTVNFTAFAQKCGDVNGNAEVDAEDQLILSRFVAKWSGYKIDKAFADLDKNESIDIIDVIILTRNLANWTGYDTLPMA